MASLAATRRRATGPLALAALLVLLLACASLPSGADAHNYKGSRKSKSKRTQCASLEKNCGFITDGGDSDAVDATFTLSVAGDGSVTCTPSDASVAQCEWDDARNALLMALSCPGGESYSVVQETCGPLDEDGALDPWRLPAAGVTPYFNVGYCAAPEVELPDEGESLKWYMYVMCIPGPTESGSSSSSSSSSSSTGKLKTSAAAAAGGRLAVRAASAGSSSKVATSSG